MVVNKGVLAFLAFVAGAIFAGFGLFGVPIGDINLLFAALFCYGLGFVLERAPI